MFGLGFFAELQSKSWQAPGRSVMGQTSVLKLPCPVCLPVQKKELVANENFFFFFLISTRWGFC